MELGPIQGYAPVSRGAEVRWRTPASPWRGAGGTFGKGEEVLVKSNRSYTWGVLK